jgi:bifunctional N-acetylglucosamine-1-phosphate-uridyltransferase/glucosamine-1-phosphate-acetyltransferase GlmU-like protein
MSEWRVLSAAAGRGTRAGLPYPKTLFPIQGRPILARILDLVKPYDASPTVVVSPSGREPVAQSLAELGLRAHLVEQAQALGMGHAVLQWLNSPACTPNAQIILLWGDVPFIQASTLQGAVEAHVRAQADFTFATRLVDSAYTVVQRDAQGQVTGLIETREEGAATGPAPGERDIGLFVFDAAKVLPVLQEEHPRKFGRTTGEHGFLYLVGALAERGLKVQAVPIATELDLVSLNSLKDVDAYL